MCQELRFAQVLCLGADAADACKDALAFVERGLQIFCECPSTGHVIMAAQKFSVVSHRFSSVADCAYSCHRIGLTIKDGFEKSKSPYPRERNICYDGIMFAITTVPEGLTTATSIIAIAIAVIFHEVAHGYVANYLGDSTAKYAGRLSLNPIRHIDMLGTVIIPLLLILSKVGFVFGWAKPVPVNYYNLRYGKWGPVLVALAGPVTNFLILLICGFLFRISPAQTAFPYLFLIIALVNAFLMLFNLLPIPPLDGSKVLFLFLDRRPDIVMMLERYGMFILLAVIVFARGLLVNLVFLPALQLVSMATGVSLLELVNIL